MARESRWTEVRKVLFSLPAALGLVLLAYYVFMVLAAYVPWGLTRSCLQRPAVNG